MLQAYATERAVASLGSECEIIDYYVNQDNTLFQRPTGLGSAAHDAHTALHYGPLKARYERFEAFSRENLNISGRRYQSLEELRQAELPYDVLLSGSDQIWNPKIFPDGRFDPVFFGAFSHKRKIAYAPSFGIPRIPDGMEEELRTYLESFSHLSVRERQGQGIVRDITGKDVPVVLDPTLLLERTDWAAAARDGGAGRGYILCYCISRPDALAPYIRRLAEETGLPVVQLCGVRQKVHPKARCILSAGPAEFLGLFRDAAYVCTNSFHGTVFSVQFQKPFFTAVAPAEMAAPESSRTFSLLSRLGLGERIIGKGDTANLTAPIDWAAVGERLGRERKLSLDYLRCALEDRPHTPEEAPVKAEERPLPHLADHTHCTGCTACASGCPKDAITMERDREGFAYPVIDGAACVRCGHCTAVCPVLRERPQSSMPAVFAAWNRNDEIRRDSTSGGVFTLLAEYILESGGVVFGAAFDGSQHLRHTACFRKEELWRLRGAKYVQSDLEGVFREVWRWLDQRPVLFSGTPRNISFIAEEYIDGLVETFDGITDSQGNILICSSHVMMESIMDTVNEGGDTAFYGQIVEGSDIKEVGSRVVKAFDAKQKFFHFEFFRLGKDKAGLGKKGDLVGLEVNMRAPGAYIPDMMNYSYNANVYDIFADMLIYDRCFIEPKQQYCIGYAGRRDGLKYKHHSQQIRMKFKDQLISHEIVPDALAAAMGNQVYLLRAKNEKEIQEMIKYVLEKKDSF